MRKDHDNSISSQRFSEDSREYAFRIIREKILLFSLPPGKRLSGPELAGTLGLSRTPVQDALERLEREGLVTSENTPGFCAASIDLTEVRDSVWLIELFTTEVLHAFFIEQVAPQKIEILQFMLQKAKEAWKQHDLKTLLRTVQNAFTQLYTFGGNYDLIWQALRGRSGNVLRVIFLLSRDCPDAEDFYSQLQQMVDALSRRDDDAAVACERAAFAILLADAARLQKQYPDWFTSEKEDTHVKRKCEQ